jgi:hypothetical protein
MSELIVLGLIPGTQVQITFFLWILLVVTAFSCGIIWVGHRTHIFRDWIIAFALLKATQRPRYLPTQA